VRVDSLRPCYRYILSLLYFGAGLAETGTVNRTRPPYIVNSYASRVVQKFKAEGLVETRRKAFLVRNVEGLRAKACLCDAVSKRHFEQVMDGLHSTED
jgi:hypothetical protein